MNTAGEVSAIMVECKGPPFLYRGNTGSGALAAIFGLFSFPVCVFPFILQVGCGHSAGPGARMAVALVPLLLTGLLKLIGPRAWGRHPDEYIKRAVSCCVISQQLKIKKHPTSLPSCGSFICRVSRPNGMTVLFLVSGYWL